MTTELTPVRASALDALKTIHHGFFTRPGGVSQGIYAGLNAGLGSGDDRTSVVENRKKISHWLGITDENLATPYQVHSPDVVVTDTAWHEERPKADAVVTDKPGLAIGIVTADCGPVLFADENAKVIGAAHAGWKGALTGVLENTIAEMEKLGAQRGAITAVLGPTISQQNYEVGPDFPTPFLDQNESNREFFTPSQKDGHFMFDLTGYIVQRLNEAGVHGTSVDICTYGNESDFYSYRRTTHRQESDYGRQLSAIVLDPEKA